MEVGYKHNEVDEMDTDHFLSLLDSKTKNEKKEKISSIENVFPMF